MLSSPIFSKRDATIIAILLFIGIAMTIESHHHIRILAPTESTDLVQPSAEPTLAPASVAAFEPARNSE